MSKGTWVTRLGWTALSALVVVWLAPWTPLRGVEVVAMLVALDKVLAVAAGAVVVLLAVIGFRHRVARWPVVLVSSWLIMALLFAGRVFIQGVNDVSSAGPQRPLLTVVSWNAQGIPPESMMDRLIEVIRDRDVDVVVLPETGDVIGERAAEQLDYLGWENVFFGPEATSVIIRRGLAESAGYNYIAGNPPWAGITVVPATPSAGTPIIVAAHIQQPSPGNVGVRAEHLDWIQRICDENEYVLAVGDFNSTLNHLDAGELGRCADIAVEHGAGAASTWPTWLPTWLGISIDRAMVGPPYNAAESTFEIIREIDLRGVDGWGSGRGADHWPILVTVGAVPR